MNKKIKIELGPTQKTMLIPLFGRSEETKKENGLILDDKAVEIVESVEYDFSKWVGKASLVGAVLRTVMFDEFVNEYLKQYPNGTIVEIGVGLNTRFERLDNGHANWIEIDLEDSIQLRRQFFSDNERRKIIIANFQDTTWYHNIRNLDHPICFVSEAAIIYIDSLEIKSTIKSLKKEFENSWFLTDTCSQSMVKKQGSHEVMKTMPKESWFKWACDDPNSLSPWGLKLIRSRHFSDITNETKKKLPLSWKLLFFISPKVVQFLTKGYRINFFKLK